MADTTQIGEVRNSMGNGEAKELICTTHGHELRGIAAGWGDTGEKKIGNCNSIISKIYLNKIV